MKMKHYSLRLYNLLELLMMKRIKQGGNMIKSTKKGRHINFYYVSCIFKNDKSSIKKWVEVQYKILHALYYTYKILLKNK
jgi:hypothetical protein